MPIVLLHVSGTVPVEIEVLAVTSIRQILKGQEDVRADGNGIDLVPPKKMFVEGLHHAWHPFCWAVNLEQTFFASVRNAGV